MANGFTANFGESKGGLSTVQWAWLDSAGDVIGSWTGSVLELEADTGIYYIYVEQPAEAYWLAWRTGDSDEWFLVLGLQEKAFVFDFGIANTGKSIGYRYYTSSNTPIVPEITTDIIEFQNAGIFLALNVVIPEGAVFVKARTIEAESKWVGGAIDFDSTIYYQLPRSGPIQEER
jgi:hypothetical protein